jgi:hypothetical protein
VSCPLARACTAVGYYKTGTSDLSYVTLAERWSGSRWSRERTVHPAGGKNVSLVGVSCPSTRACTAVGYYKTRSKYVTLAERWNGKRWSLESTPNPGGSPDSELNGVSCPSTGACVAVGEYRKGSKYVTLAERWNGSRWSLERMPNPAGGKDTLLEGVACPRTSVCTAVGYHHLSGTTFVSVAERWNGSGWSLQRIPSPTGAPYTVLLGVSCAAPYACTAVGSSNFLPLAERWNGHGWTIASPPNPTDGSFAFLNSVSCAPTGVCTAVGTYINGTPTVTLAERWNGSRWSIQPTPNPTGSPDSELHAVSCPAARTCNAVGYYNNGTKYVTLSEHWQRAR